MAKRQIVGFDSMTGFRYVADAVKDFRKQQNEGTVARAQGGDGGDDVSAMGCFNGEATDCPAFGIMLCNGAQQDSNDWWHDKGKRPDTYGCQNNFLIADSAGVKAGKGGGVQSGAGPIGNRYIVAYDSSDGTPAAGEMWGPRSGTFLAKKNTGGFRVIKAFDTTNHWMLCYAQPFVFFRGTTDAAIVAGATGTVSIFYRSSSTAFTDTTANVTVLNGLDVDVAISKVVYCQWLPQSDGTEGWVVTQAAYDCP